MEKLNDWKVYEHAIQVLCYDERRREIYRRKYGQYMTAETPVIKKLAEKRNEAFNRMFGFKYEDEHYGSDYYAGSTYYEYGMEGNAFHPHTVLRESNSWSEKGKSLCYYSGISEEYPLGRFSDNYGVSSQKYMFGGDGTFTYCLGHMLRYDPHASWCGKGNRDYFLMTNGKLKFVKGKGWVEFVEGKGWVE